jgi:HlyD family secretion protein
MPADLSPPRPAVSMRGAALFGAFASLALLAILVAWAGMTGISGAVVASGSVAVAGKPKAVQHLDGGIVRDIRVADGDLVQAGDLLMQLDDTLLRANLEIYRNRLAEAVARRDRLVAERNGLPEPVFQTDHPLLWGHDPTAIHDGERAVFAARAEIQAGRVAQLQERVRQFRNQIEGVAALVAAKRDQIGFIETELARMRSLQERQLVREAQVLTLEGTRADLLGQVAEHVSETARIENSIRDAELEMLQTARTFKEQAVTELRDVATQIEELTQQIVTTEKQLQRVDITAPVAGFVHEMQIVTIGGVVAPGALIAQIIPTGEGQTFEFRVPPQSVDQVHAGQPVRLVFSAFNQRTTPELHGQVVSVSPTTVVDEATGMAFFRVHADVTPDELARLGDLVLVPGMPVEGFIGTQERSVASYLLRPFTEQLQRAFRED